MTYPPNPPTNPGYPMPQQSGYGGPVPGYLPTGAGPSRLPVYLTGAVVALGFGAYLASFGPLLRINTDIGPFGGAEFTASGLSYWTVAALLAALLAAVSLLPKAAGAAKPGEGRPYAATIAVSAVLGVLLVIAQVVNRPAGFSIGWALWLVLFFTALQAIAAVAALLFGTGVLTAPAPRPRYEPYGQFGPPGSYYPGVPGPAQGGPGYPTPYAGYPPGGAAAEATDTPPSGFPAYSPPAGQPAAPPSAPQSSSGSAADPTQS